MDVDRSTVSSLPTPQVLIVDDEPDTRELLSEFCRAQGYHVATAHDGRAAIAAISRNPAQFAIIITDLHMPGADGFEVLQAARSASPTIYVVMITGYAGIDSAVRAVREGAYDYLAKPFALGQLEVILHRIRDRMDLERENRVLSKSASPSDSSRLSGEIGWRLLAIEQRLAQIEALLRVRHQ